jgi:hypothetical protein
VDIQHDLHESGFPIVYCSVDPVRPGQNWTVSFACPYCKHRRKPWRHTHGNPFHYTEPGQEIGHRISHCFAEGERFGSYVLVLGPERFNSPPTAKKRGGPQALSGRPSPSCRGRADP